MNRHCLIPLAALLWTSCAIATPCSAQDKPDRTVILGLKLDGAEIRIEIDGDDVKVTADGKPLPADRLETRGNTITLKDLEGLAAARIVRWNQGAQIRRVPRSDKAAIGVELNPLSKGLADHLDLDPHKVLYIRRAVEGRAAAKAGVRDHDILISIDGKSPVDEKVLHRILDDKKPGDPLKVRVLRRGKELDCEIRCDRARRGAGISFGDYGRLGLLGVNEDLLLDMTTTLRPLQYRVEDFKPFGVGRYPLGVKKPKAGSKPDSMGFIEMNTGKGKFKVVDPRRDPFFDRVKGAKSDRSSGDLDKKIDSLEKRFDRLESMLEKLLNKKKI